MRIIKDAFKRLCNYAELIGHSFMGSVHKGRKIGEGLKEKKTPEEEHDKLTDNIKEKYS